MKSRTLPVSQNKILVLFSLLTLLILLVFRRLFFLGEIPFTADTVFFYFPNWAVGNRIFSEAGSLLWDPYRNMGQPFLAVPQTMSFHPVRWIGLFSGFLQYIRIFYFLHLFCAGVFGYLFLKGWTRCEEAGWLGAVGFAFMGPMFMKAPLQSDFAVMALIPAVLWALLEGRVVLTAFFLALQWFSGFPPALMVGLTGCAVLGWASPRPRVWFKTLALGGAIALGLAAIQLVPFLELIKESNRGLHISSEKAFINSATPARLVRGLGVPAFFTHFHQGPHYYVVDFYLGPLLVLLGGAALSRKRVGWILAGGMTFGFLLSLGRFLFFYEWIPLIRVFRYPANWILLGGICLTVLAGMGLSRFKTGRTRGVLVGLIVLDMLMFVWPLRHGWAAVEFFTGPGAPLPELTQTTPGRRVYHDEKIMVDYGKWNSFPGEFWPLTQRILLPSLPAARGISETSSYSTLTSRRNYEFRENLILEPNLKEKRLAEANVETVLDYDRSGAGVPSMDQFSVRRRAKKHDGVFMGEGGDPARVLEKRPGFIRARVSREGQAVFSEVFSKGWKASFEGVPLPLEPYDGTFLSVRAPRDGEVVFEYDPFFFKLGAGISILTLLLLWWKKRFFSGLF